MKEQHPQENLVLPQTVDDTSQGQPAPILHTQGLTKEYRSGRATFAAKALNGIDLDVYQRNFASIMGPSGSGKTTLLNLLAGLDRPSSGEVWLQEHNMGTLTANQLALFRRRHLGFVFQDFNLLHTLTLAENVALPLSLGGRSSKEIQQRVQEIMEALGIAQYGQRYPYEVSGGQQQRTAIARAVVHRPFLLLADEPTGNLDSASARTLLALLQQLNEQQQVTILMVTHDPLAASYSKRVVFLKDGRVFTHLERTANQHADQVYAHLDSIAPPTDRWHISSFVISNWQQSGPVITRLQRYLPTTEQGLLTGTAISNVGLEQLLPVMLFSGFFISSLFFLAAGCSIYFKLFTQQEEDRRQFQALERVGLLKREAGWVLSIEFLLLFFLPVGLGIVHSAVALTDLVHLLAQFGDASQAIAPAFGKVCLLYVACFLVYFIIARVLYLRRVYTAIA